MSRPDSHEPGRTPPGLLLGAAIGSVAGAAAVLGGGLLWRWRQATPGIAAGAEDLGARGLPETPPSPAALERGFEPSDMRAGTLARSMAVLFLAAFVAIALTVAMLAAFGHARRGIPAPTRLQDTTIVPPQPRLQADPLQEYKDAMQAMDRAAGSWSWLDAAHTHARVPLQRGAALSVGHSLDDDATPVAP
ncbi:hypothetical protein [Lichenicoccus roseus]|uniref:Uncharacterized protein n=1 Tax=Lichenicoccus roseus TaxID=2683649 RepID=A0A5R9J775_9PROT|nr:hypothetical protein [Lichenicoccus roseus]TLU73474.1 hypothetical protein FE263_08795 [Lichenicoccus roseus]